MAPRKLADSDKQEILSLYRGTDETTLSLAGRFGVSTSTISRILKQNLSESEYDALIHTKRASAAKSSKASRTGSKASQDEQLSLPTPKKSAATPSKSAPSEQPDEASDNGSTSPRRGRRRRSAADEPSPTNVLEELDELEKEIQQELRHSVYENLSDDTDDDEDEDDEDVIKPTPKPKKALNLDDLDVDDDDLDDADDDLDDAVDALDEDLDDEDEDDELLDDDEEYIPVHLQPDALVQILPLADAMLPRTCYLVVDRSAELVTRPLSEFAELGQIPEVELQERTLPVFDNHRVAKRFMRRMQRIVKIPDSQMFHKVSPYLQAKGITRLLVDGQVYALNGADDH